MRGIVGAQQEAASAAHTVIVAVEQLVESEVVRSDPTRTVIPSHAVTAVAPGGAHPSYTQAPL